jgi:hypothetical protein
VANTENTEVVESTEKSGPRSQMHIHEAQVAWIQSDKGVDLSTLSPAEVIAWAYATRVEWRSTDRYQTVKTEAREAAERERSERKAATEAARAEAKAKRDAEAAEKKAAREAEAAKKADGKTEAKKATKKSTAKTAPSETEGDTEDTGDAEDPFEEG